MGLQFIKSGNAVTNRQDIAYIPAGRYKEFVMVTNIHMSAAAATITIDPINIAGFTGAAWTGTSHIGRYRLMRGDEELHNTTLAYITRFNDIKGGNPLLTGIGTAGGATIRGVANSCEVSSIIPVSLVITRDSQPNAFEVKDSSEAYINIQWDSALLNADTITISDMNWILYGVTTDTLEEKYQLKIYEQDYVSAGAARIGDNLAGANIGMLHMFPATAAGAFSEALCSAIQLSADGVVAIPNVDDRILQVITNYENQLETTLNGLREVRLAGRDGLNGFLQAFAKTLRLEADFTIAGTLKTFKHSVSFDAARSRLSSVGASASRATRLSAVSMTQPDARAVLATVGTQTAV